MRFETDASAYPDLVLLPSENPNSSLKYYRRPSDELKIGGATLTAIMYQFYAGRLTAVMLFAQGAGSCTALQDALRAQYGYGSPALRVTYESRWNASKVDMYYRYRPGADEAVVRIYSKQMRDLSEKGDKDAAKSAKSDL